MQTSYTDQQRQDFRDRFELRRRRQLVATVPTVIVIFATAILQRDGSGTLAGVPEPVIGSLFVVAIVGILVFSLLNWRCPACQSYLGRSISPRFCQKCGVELRS